MKALRRSPLALAMAGALTAAAAEQPQLLKSGELLWDGSAHELAGARPAGEDWRDQWQEALDYQDWDVQRTAAGLRLTSGRLEMAKLLIAMDAAASKSGALHGTQQSTDDGRSTIEAVTALSLDGNLYSPALLEYLHVDGLVVFNTGRGLYCASQGDSAGHTTADITAIVDSRIVPLDGRSGVTPIEYELVPGIIHVRSAHGDMACGPADAVRLTMSAPESVSAGVPTQWAVRATNHSDATVENVAISVDWQPAVTALQASSNCTASDNHLNCTRPSLAPGETWEEVVDVTASQGTLLGYCEGTMTSEGRVAGDNCLAESNIAAPVWVEAIRSGPTQIQPGVSFTWEITLSNVGTETAESVQLMDVTLPGDDIRFLQAAGAACTASQSADQTSVNCDLLEAIPPGGQQAVQIEMRADKEGSYEAQCQVQWQGGQANEPITCDDTLEVAIEDTIFQSRFEID